MSTATGAVLGAIVEYYYVPDNSQKAIEKMADPWVKIIPLIITEGGYNFDDDTGAFKWKVLPSYPSLYCR